MFWWFKNHPIDGRIGDGEKMCFAHIKKWAKQQISWYNGICNEYYDLGVSENVVYSPKTAL